MNSSGISAAFLQQFSPGLHKKDFSKLQCSHLHFAKPTSVKKATD